jgi:hypothetical protein
MVPLQHSLQRLGGIDDARLNLGLQHKALVGRVMHHKRMGCLLSEWCVCGVHGVGYVDTGRRSRNTRIISWTVS